MSSPGSHTPTVASLKVEPFRGGNQLMMGGGIVGVVLLAITLAAGGMTSPKDTFYSYLVAFAYWCGIAFASVLLLMIFHAVHARWMTILRRPVEVMASTMAIFLLLIIPIWIGMKDLYSWIDPVAAGFNREALAKIAHKARWLNVNFFIVRSVLYILFATFVGWRLYGMSRRQDKEGGTELTVRMRRASGGLLPFMAVAITFAAFDWLMSLNPTWYSTIFGVYFFAGSFLSALSILAIVTWQANRKNAVRRRHEHRAHAQHRQADARLHLLLDVHRLLAVPADLDRRPPRGDPVLHHALQRRVGVDGHLPHLLPLLRAVRRAAVALAEAQPAASWRSSRCGSC